MSSRHLSQCLILYRLRQRHQSQIAVLISAVNTPLLAANARPSVENPWNSRHWGDHYWSSLVQTQSCHRFMHESTSPPQPPLTEDPPDGYDRWLVLFASVACMLALIQFGQTGISHLQGSVRLLAQESNLPTLTRDCRCNYRGAARIRLTHSK